MAVSVLIVNYRVYDDLDRSLSALAPYLGADDEVIVVDNVSDPDRLAWLSTRHPRIRTIAHRENLGFAAGVNLAARASSRAYLVVLNPDTEVQGPVPRVLEAWLRDHPDTGAAGPQVLNADGSVQPSARRFPGITTAIGGRSTWLTSKFPGNWATRRNLVGLEATTPVDVDWVAGSCLGTTRAAFERVGGFDPEFFLDWEDADYGLRLRAAGLKTTYVPTVAVRHAGGHSAEQVPELAIRAFHRSALRLRAKHGGWFARVSQPMAAVVLGLRAKWQIRRAGLRSSTAAPR